MIKNGLEAIVNNWLFFILLIAFLRLMEWGIVKAFRRILAPLGKLRSVKALIILMSVIIVVMGLFNAYLLLK
jgi:hypothetical protein